MTENDMAIVMRAPRNSVQVKTKKNVSNDIQTDDDIFH